MPLQQTALRLKRMFPPFEAAVSAVACRGAMPLPQRTGSASFPGTGGGFRGYWFITDCADAPTEARKTLRQAQQSAAIRTGWALRAGRWFSVAIVSNRIGRCRADAKTAARSA